MLKLAIAPDIEPVTLAEAKAHLRVDTDAEDIQIQRLVTTARQQIELVHGISIIHQVWRWTFNRWPDGGSFVMPLNPIASIDRVRVATAPGTLADIPVDALVLDGDPIHPRVSVASNVPAPAVPREGIELVFTAGFGMVPAAVPAPIRHAILLIVAAWFENREPDHAAVLEYPAVTSLLQPWRRVLL